MSELRITACEFYSMTLSEIGHLLDYNRRQSKLKLLDLAYYTGCFVMNEKANDTYKDISNDILGFNKSEATRNDIKRFKMISQRLDLKYPGERVE